jgi:hypothetical protein
MVNDGKTSPQLLLMGHKSRYEHGMLQQYFICKRALFPTVQAIMPHHRI